MKTVCAWCGVVTKQETPDGELQGMISHGMCETCFFHLVAEGGMPLQQFLDGLGVPIVVVDEDVTVETANKTACTLLGKDLTGVKGFRPGQVFECSHAYLPEGCGETVHCGGCTIRRSVTETLHTGKAVTRRPAFFQHGTTGERRQIEMLISTQLVANVVLLRIDDLKAPRSLAS